MSDAEVNRPGVEESAPEVVVASAPAAHPVPLLDAFLAGLQSGMAGVLWMLAWLGLSSVWLRRSFWLPENLMATLFHPSGPILNGFGSATVSGLALFLFLYSLIGGLFAMAFSGRPPRPARAVLLATLFGLVWYYFTYHFVWKMLSPALALLHAERPAVIGHVLYGLLLGRFYSHFPTVAKPAIEALPAASPAEIPSDSVAPKG
jgi:hypothetical protein